MYGVKFFVARSYMITRYQVLDNVLDNTLPSTTERQRTSQRTYITMNHNFILTLPIPSLQNETTNMVIKFYS